VGREVVKLMDQLPSQIIEVPQREGGSSWMNSFKSGKPKYEELNSGALPLLAIKLTKTIAVQTVS